MNCKLRHDCQDCVGVENVGQRPLLGQSLERLGPGDEEEAAGQQQPLEGGLAVAELDSLEVEDALAVGEDQRVQGEDLEHLQRGDERAAALLDHVVDARDAGGLAGEGRGDGGVPQLDDGRLLRLLQLLQHLLQLLLLGSQPLVRIVGFSARSVCTWTLSFAVLL